MKHLENFKKSLIFRLVSKQEVFRSTDQLWYTVESLPESFAPFSFTFNPNEHLLECLFRFSSHLCSKFVRMVSYNGSHSIPAQFLFEQVVMLLRLRRLIYLFEWDMFWKTFRSFMRGAFEQVIYLSERPIAEMTINIWELEFLAYSFISLLRYTMHSYFLS